MRDGIKTDARDTLTTEGYGELLYYIKECQKVSFAPRMWRDFAYQRLAAYDISAILRKFDRSSSYKSGRTYRLICGDERLDAEINYYAYYDHDDVAKADTPPNEIMPYDNLNFIYVSDSEFLLFDGSAWTLMQRLPNGRLP